MENSVSKYLRATYEIKIIIVIVNNTYLKVYVHVQKTVDLIIIYVS